jgi:hypothetical protein
MENVTTVKCVYCGIEADVIEWVREGDSIDNYICDHCKTWEDSFAVAE